MSAAILSCSRAARTTVLTRCAARCMTTEAATPSEEDNAPLPSPPQHHAAQSKPRNIRGNSLHVRAWDEIDSMPAFYAMVRAIEQRFGRVREYRVVRDSDQPTNYGGFFIVDLAEEGASQRLPEKSMNIRVEVPISPNRPGGVGLDELQDLLLPQDRDPTLTASQDGIYSQPIRPFPVPAGSEVPTRTVELIVQRALNRRAANAPGDQPVKRRMAENPEFGVAFARWGGFAPPEKMSRYMKQALLKWQPLVDARRPKTPRAADAAADAETLDTPAPEFAERAEDVARELDVTVRAEEPAKALDTTLPAAQPPFDELPHPPAPDAPVATAAAAVTAAKADVPAESTDASAPAPAPAPAPKRLSQKERILQRARQHAKTPLPAPLTAEAEEQKKAEEEKRAREEKTELDSVRKRLLRLVNPWS
ncbi:hypothetical protein BD413DRAFT_577168 [Trametes elegans]|nr:hypothetical protein BD413DRAFT_577168 [Trametes elegans]